MDSTPCSRHSAEQTRHSSVILSTKKHKERDDGDVGTATTHVTVEHMQFTVAIITVISCNTVMMGDDEDDDDDYDNDLTQFIITVTVTIVLPEGKVDLDLLRVFAM